MTSAKSLRANVNSRRLRAGFTLMEVLIVLAILAITTTIAVQSLGPIANQSRIQATLTTLNEIRAAVLGNATSTDATQPVTGFVAEVRTTFDRPAEYTMPCHEFCGLGHSQMWATVRVVPPESFRPDADGRVACEKP